MKKYDYKKAIRLIQKHKPRAALLGMAEDWYWTAVTIYEKGKYLIPLHSRADVAGISGSKWATPTITLEFKDGKTLTLPCYKVQ